jgi:aromatic ring-cleaving dioxygenase
MPSSDGHAGAGIVRDPALIESWHAHVYFGADTRDAAQALRELIAAELGALVRIGRFHERPVGPHPAWTYQLAFDGPEFAYVTAWLVLNHGALDVFIHPNTGDALRDHRDSAVWIGKSWTLDLAALG